MQTETADEPIRKTLMIVSTITYVENAPENYEHPKGNSLTVPDMAMSLQTIMDKYVQGNPIDNQETVFFDQEFPDIRMMSKTDLLEAQQGIEAELEVIRQRVQEFNEIEEFEKEGKAKQKAKEEKIDKLAEKLEKLEKQDAS